MIDDEKKKDEYFYKEKFQGPHTGHIEAIFKRNHKGHVEENLKGLVKDEEHVKMEELDFIQPSCDKEENNIGLDFPQPHDENKELDNIQLNRDREENNIGLDLPQPHEENEGLDPIQFYDNKEIIEEDSQDGPFNYTKVSKKENKEMQRSNIHSVKYHINEKKDIIIKDDPFIFQHQILQKQSKDGRKENLQLNAKKIMKKNISLLMNIFTKFLKNSMNFHHQNMHILQIRVIRKAIKI